jgi:hypothetical protein
MACITLFAQPIAMATTQLVRLSHHETASTRGSEGNVERKFLRMSWVVVTDEKGNRQLRMQWASADEC